MNEEMKLEIVMARGDRTTRSFRLTKSGNPYTDSLDEIYFSVKKSGKDKKLLFQKRFTDAEIQYIGNGRYQFTILPEDTNNLEFDKEYDFDIELVKEDEIKKTFTGILKLTTEVTHAADEGARV